MASPLSVSPLCVSRGRYSQRSGRHVPAAGDGIQRERPGTEAPQTHRASPRDLCMTCVASAGTEHVPRALWDALLETFLLTREGHVVNKSKKAAKRKNIFFGWMILDRGSEGTGTSSPPGRARGTKLEKQQHVWSLTWLTTENFSQRVLFFFLNQGTKKKKKMQTCKLMRMCFCTTAAMKNPTTRGTARLLHCHLQGSLSITRFAILTERGKRKEKEIRHLCSTNNKHTKWLWAPVKRYWAEINWAEMKSCAHSVSGANTEQLSNSEIN